MLPPKTPRELVIHAILFEVLATSICAPLFAWIMDKSLVQMGSMTVLIAFIAMVWNMIYNALFERIEGALGWRRTPKIRVLHACCFECSLTIIVVPLAAWWLSINLVTAFSMEIGMILFFLPYTYIFNLIYDIFRAHRFQKRALVLDTEEAVRA